MKTQRGGKRPNSGAKPKFDEPMKSVPILVPVSIVKAFRKRAYDLREEMVREQKNTDDNI